MSTTENSLRVSLRAVFSLRPRLIWSVLGLWSVQVEAVNKEDVASEAVAGLRQC